MSVPAKTLKENKVLKVIHESYDALLNMFKDDSKNDCDYELENLIEETKKKNPELTSDLDEILNISKKMDKSAKTQFDSKNTFGSEMLSRNEFVELENKLSGIEVEVSEEKAIENLSDEREKGGRQRTIVDED